MHLAQFKETFIPFDLVIDELFHQKPKSYPCKSDELEITFHAGPIRKVNRRSNLICSMVMKSHKNNKAVTCESAIEFDGFHYLEAHWLVKSYQEQSVTMRFFMDGIWQTHYPDCIAELTNGQMVLIEFKPDSYLKDDALKARTKLLAELVQSHGLFYVVVIRSQLPLTRTQNAKTLSFRPAKAIEHHVINSYSKAFQGRPFLIHSQLKHDLGPKYHLKSLYYLICQGMISFDWGQPLNQHTMLQGRFPS